MTTVFLSGSRNISRINDMIRSRIQNMIDQGFSIFLGDANGADKALQCFLAEKKYRNVIVFCSGKTCRNNFGDWLVRDIEVDPKFKGREFYTQKDKVMAAEADYGLVLWDGKSTGSLSNIFELLKRSKSVIVYLSSQRKFVKVANLQDIEALLQTCDSADLQSINKKINAEKLIENLRPSRQTEFHL